MPWRRVRSGRRVDGTDCGDDGSAPGRERDMVEVPELWGGGNAASLMEARGMARKQIREEIANARHGFAGVESQREEERIPEAGGDYTGNGSLRGDVDHAKNEPAEDKTMHEQMKTSPEEIAMLRRIGLNHAEVMKVLKSLIGSIDPRAPMRVIKYSTFKDHGRIPRSNEKKTVLLSEVPDNAEIAFISHRWLRPWPTKKECEENGHTWAGMAHPDDDQASKHKLVCDGLAKMAESKDGWDLEKVYLWVDFAGVEQDDSELLMAGVASLRGYIALCDTILVPAVARPEIPEGATATVDMVPGGYGERAWTRLEAMSMYAVSVLKQVEAPEIYVAAGDGASYLERVDYVLKELPSSGQIFDKRDLEYIKEHEDAFLREIKASVLRNGFIAKHEDGSAKCVAFDPKDPNGDLVASCARKNIKLVNRQTGTTVWNVKVEASICSLAFNKDGSMLAAGGSRGLVQVWTVKAGSRPVNKWTIKDPSRPDFSCVSFSPDGELLAVAGDEDGCVRLWSRDGEEMGILKGHREGAGEPAYQGMFWQLGGFGTPSGAETVAEEENEEEEALVGHEGIVMSVSWSPDSKTLATAGRDGTVRLWTRDGDEKCILSAFKRIDPDTGEEEVRKGRLFSVSWAPDGETIASCGDRGIIHLWTRDGEEKTTLQAYQKMAMCVAFSPDGKTLVSVGRVGESTRGRLGNVCMWRRDGDEWTRDGDVEAGTCGRVLWSDDGVGNMKGVLDLGLEGEVLSVHCSQDNKTFAFAGRDGTVRLWTRGMDGKGTLKKRHEEGIDGNLEDTSSVTDMEWSPDGTILASGGHDGTVRLWTRDGKQKSILSAYAPTDSLMSSPKVVSSVVFSPDNTLLASVGEDVRLWTFDGEERGTIAVKDVKHVEFSPDGTTLISIGRSEDIRLWTRDGEEKGKLQGHTAEVKCVKFSPDGTMIASADKSGTVRLWTYDGEEKCILEERHSGEVTFISWPTDSSTLTTASSDRVCEWTRDGEEKRILLENPKHGWGHSSFYLYSENRMFIAKVCGNSVRLWTADGKCKTPIELNGNHASWQHLDADTKALAGKVDEAGSGGDSKSGQYIVTAEDDKVYVYHVTLEALSDESERVGEALACFRSPSKVVKLLCWESCVVVGCVDGQVLFLEIPLLSYFAF